jgi:hypothetical protein
MGARWCDYKFDLGLRRSKIFLQSGLDRFSRARLFCLSGKSLGRFSLAFSLGRFRCLARHTPKADPEKVCSGFPSRQTQRVCAEIMLNQKSRAQWERRESGTAGFPRCAMNRHGSFV